MEVLIFAVLTPSTIFAKQNIQRDLGLRDSSLLVFVSLNLNREDLK